ncbi:head-to-tail adaptor [Rhodobacter phage RcRudolph]|nr:head-to-tail adaptor [Rhodobacter phage RcRudolph]
MAFTVQGDTPVVGANAYIDVATFRAYWDDRGVATSPTYNDTAVQVAIVKGTQYLDLRFEYVGERLNRDQELEWPRQFAYNDRGDSVSGLPTAVKNATCEYAYRALTMTALLADPSYDETGRPLKSKEETVGPLTEKYEYEAHGVFTMPDYPQADRILISRGLVRAGLTSGQTGGLMSGSIGRA